MKFIIDLFPVIVFFVVYQQRDMFDATAAVMAACALQTFGNRAFAKEFDRNHLLAAKRDLDLPRALRKLDRFDVLILDDLGYLKQRANESEVLFTLIAERYERRSIIVTSNMVFSQWEEIFQSPMARIVNSSSVFSTSDKLTLSRKSGQVNYAAMA